KQTTSTYLLHFGVIVLSRVCARASHDDLGAVQYGAGFEGVIVDVSRGFVEAVGHRLKVNRDRRNLLGVGLVTMGKTAPMWRNVRTSKLLTSKLFGFGD